MKSLPGYTGDEIGAGLGVIIPWNADRSTMMTENLSLLFLLGTAVFVGARGGPRFVSRFDEPRAPTQEIRIQARGSSSRALP